MLGALANAGSAFAQGYLRAVTASLQDQRRKQIADEDRRAETSEWERRQQLQEQVREQREQRQAAAEAVDPERQLRVQLLQAQVSEAHAKAARAGQPQRTLGEVAPQGVRKEFHQLPHDEARGIPSQYLVPVETPAQRQSREQQGKAEGQKQVVSTVEQLKKKITERAINYARARTPEEQERARQAAYSAVRALDKLANDAGGVGTTGGAEWVKALRDAEKAEATSAGQRLNEESKKARLARTQQLTARGSGGGGRAPARQKAASGQLTAANRAVIYNRSYNRARDEVLGPPGMRFSAPTPQQIQEIEDRAQEYTERTTTSVGGSTPTRTPAAPTRPAQQGGFNSLPPAGQYSGKTIKDTSTGKRYRSNGKSWVEVK